MMAEAVEVETAMAQDMFSGGDHMGVEGTVSFDEEL